MSSKEWAAQALQAFDALVQSAGGLCSRPGQRQMAQQVARTLSRATLKGERAAPRRAIAVIEAGTGVGKSLAYCAPAITLALARGTRVLISTATVALQEQLVHKDLPALAAALPKPFDFVLAKGRARYVCKLKLDRLAGGGAPAGVVDADDDLYAEEEQAAAAAAQASRPLHESQERLRFYAQLAQTLEQRSWDGDRDSLATAPHSTLWAPVAAEGASCTGRYCPAYGQCSYYDKRRELVAAQVIVVNHDLLLSSLGARLLPDLDNCLLILDEAHHLPATARTRFACSMDLSHLAWIARLAGRSQRAAEQLELPDSASAIARHAAQLQHTLQELARIVTDTWGAALAGPHDATPVRAQQTHPACVRIPGGALPAALSAPLERLAASADGFLHALRAVARALRNQMREQPGQARRLATLYAQIGMLSPRLEEFDAAARLLLGTGQAPGADSAGADDHGPEEEEAAAPVAKWFTRQIEGGAPVLRAHASPILPGAALRAQLWGAVRGAVLTSATLSSCGSFEFFLREAGLHGDADVSTLAVASPFDYAVQGRLIAAQTRADPRCAAQFGAEMVAALLHDLAQVAHGALVLFTSREQLRLAALALPDALRAQVLVQGQLPRTQLLARHRERVAGAQPSIIFGMQSFGEGLDLPGRLCETVFIAKLPFAAPDDPVDQARAEWLRALGRDPFAELVVPATAIRLAQWVGRAIRSEQDRAQVFCYDRRLTHTAWGRRMLAGLPPFALLRRAPLAAAAAAGDSRADARPAAARITSSR